MNRNSDHNGSIIIAAALTGAAIALLTTRKSGKENRDKVRKAWDKMHTKKNKVVDTLQTNLEDELQAAEAKVLDLKEQIQKGNDEQRSSLFARWNEK